MDRIRIALLAVALAAAPVVAQRGRPAKEQPVPEVAPDSVDAEKEAAEQDAAKSDAAQKEAAEQGLAPDGAQLQEPVQPREVQVRSGAQVVADPRARYRTVVRMMLNIERAHRERVARLARMAEFLTAAQATTDLETLARLATLEQGRYEASLKGYERDLGPVLYGKVRAVIDGRGGQAIVIPLPKSKGATPNGAGAKPR
jgi:hypothetical protein